MTNRSYEACARRPLLGAHMSIAGGLENAIKRGDALGCEAIQIFTRNPRQWNVNPVSLPECERFYLARKNSCVKKVVSHSSYLLNLAGATDIRKKSETALIAEIERCSELGIDEVVLHPGSCGDADAYAGIEFLAESLRSVIGATESMSVKILVETMAGQGHTLGGHLEEFADLLDILEDDPRVGFCVDFCHVFAAGYDIRTASGYNRLIAALAKHVGLGNIGCWHLNDSKGLRGSRTDRHTHVGEGEIGVTPFGLLVADERFAGIPAILETPKEGIGDTGNLALLRKLRGK